MSIDFENKVLYPVRYNKKTKEFIPNERLILVRNTNDFIQEEMERIDKIFFMRRRTKEKLKRQLILNNLNALIDLFNSEAKFTLKKSDSFGRVTYFMEDIITTLYDKYNKIYPLIPFFNNKLYSSKEKLRGKFVNILKHTINHRNISIGEMSDSLYGSLLYAEFLLPIVILRMARYFIVTEKS